MKLRRTRIPPQTSVAPGCRGFTLIELLTVIAIISLLIAILLPALSKARQQARNAATAGAMKAAGDGAEMFRNELETDFRTSGGYPPSEMAEDETEQRKQSIFGAQWLVRYLMGKDLQGYAPRRNVPSNMLQGGDGEPPGWGEKDWYAYDDDGDPKVSRVGPYLPAQGMQLGAPKNFPDADLHEGDIPGDETNNVDDESLKQLVLLDSYGYPILYYAANARQANKPRPYIATYDGTEPGVFNFTDNVLFTGRCRGTGCDVQPWDFGGGPNHWIENWGTWTDDDKPPRDGTFQDDLDATPENSRSFPYYILDKAVFQSTYDTTTNVATVTPYRKGSFLMISAGSDGLYGTGDDVANFSR